MSLTSPREVPCLACQASGFRLEWWEKYKAIADKAEKDDDDLGLEKYTAL